MNKIQGTATAVVVAVAAFAGLSTKAHAGAIALSATEYQCYTEPTCSQDTFGPGTVSMLASPGAYSYADASLLSSGSTGGIISGSQYPTGYAGASFYDAFLIDITASQGSSISSTINLGSAYQITNFEERLYAYTGTTPTVGPVSGALDFWTTTANLGVGTGTIAELPSTNLAAGEYVLEVRGDVTGSNGGAFSGTLQLSPVPLPNTLPLLLSGLALLIASGVRVGAAGSDRR